MKPSVSVLCTGCEQYVCRGIQTCLAGILDNAHDETNADYLHCDIIRDTEETAGHRNQKQRSARYAGSSRRTGCRQYAKDERSRKIYGNIHGMSRRQRHSGDCNGSSRHVDGSSKGDGYGVSILIQSKALAQFHVHRNIGCRTTGKERCDKAVLQTTEYQRKRILPDAQESNQRVQNQRYERHSADQNQNQTAIA